MSPNAIPVFRGHSAGGPQRSQTKPEPWTTALKEPGSSEEQFDLQVRNLLDAIKTRRKPVADLEDRYRTATACHLANLSQRLERGLRWDPKRGEVVGDKEAQKVLTRSYRKPWDGVLKGLLR